MGDEEDRDCPCWKCWNMCSNFEPEEEERRRLTDEMQNEEGEEERRGQTNEMQREGAEMQRKEGAEMQREGGAEVQREGGAEMQREGGAEVQRGGEEEGSSVPGLGCDLQDHLQGGGRFIFLDHANDPAICNNAN